MFIEIFIVFLLILRINATYAFKNYLDLPLNHLPFYFEAFPNAIQYYCADSKQCTRELSQLLEESKKNTRNENSCWGYEVGCIRVNSYAQAHCPGDHTGWVANKQIQIDTFFLQADFGYIKQQQQEMLVMCEPLFAEDSVLECSKNMRFCRGRNLMLNFTNLLNIKHPFRYKMDVLSSGQFGKNK